MANRVENRAGHLVINDGRVHIGNAYYQTEDRCLADLRVTGPRHDRKRIKDSYAWVLDNPDFRRWRDDENHQLLWVKGDPGKGETMLLCSIIDQLEMKPAEGRLFALHGVHGRVTPGACRVGLLKNLSFFPFHLTR